MSTIERKPISPFLILPCVPDAVDDFIGQPSPAAIAALRAHPGPVTVLGAGGKMGLHLCIMLRRAFAALGRRDPVIAVSRFRTLRDRDEFARHGIEVRPCDLESAEEVAALEVTPIVFFLAGVKFGTADSPDLLERLNVLMPRRVAEHFRRATIVAFSTGCVYPFVTPESGGATETVSPAPNGAYASSCLAREHAFVEASGRHGTRAVLIRLNYSVEFRYGLLVDIALKVQRGEPIDVTMGHVNVIWQTDALNYAICALDLAASPPVPLNVTGADTLSVRALALRFGELLDRPVQLIGSEAGSAWLNNSTFAHGRFGPPATAPAKMMEWVAAWLQHGGETWNKPTGFEKRDGKF